MHENLLVKSYANGVGVASNGSLEELSGTDDMDMDQILQMLMGLREDGVRRDEKLTTISEQLKELNHFRIERVALTDERHVKIMEELRLGQATVSALQSRVAALEASGLSAWSVKKVIQWASLIAAVGTLLGAITGGIFWLVTHLKF